MAPTEPHQARQVAESFGVDPDVRMAALARRRGVEVEVGKFEDWDPRGRTFDAVIAATAWHWVNPVVGAFKAAAVLREGGVLAVFGHAFELPPELRRVLGTARAGVERDSSVPFSADPPKSVVVAYEAMYAKAADAVRQVDGFGDAEQWRVDWERTYRRDEWLDHLPTLGIITRIADDKLQDVSDRMASAIDAMGGRFTMPYATIGVTAILRSH